jgi:hypothetical protein
MAEAGEERNTLTPIAKNRETGSVQRLPRQIVTPL